LRGWIKKPVDVSHYPAGVYFVKINGSEVRMFVKERETSPQPSPKESEVLRKHEEGPSKPPFRAKCSERERREKSPES
jgi:hypothetical protein